MPTQPEALRRFRRDNTGVTILQRRASSPHDWTVDTLNARPHLAPRL